MKIFKGPISISGFQLTIDKIDGKKCLVVDFDSYILETMFESLRKTYSQIDHEEVELDFVLSYDYHGNHDVDELTYKFNQYLPTITAASDISGFYGEDDVNAMMFGFKEIEDS